MPDLLTIYIDDDDDDDDDDDKDDDKDADAAAAAAADLSFYHCALVNFANAYWPLTACIQYVFQFSPRFNTVQRYRQIQEFHIIIIIIIIIIITGFCLVIIHLCYTSLLIHLWINSGLVPPIPTPQGHGQPGYVPVRRGADTRLTSHRPRPLTVIVSIIITFSI